VRQAGDIAANVPNMLLNSPYGPEAQPTFTLRGVTTQDFSENQSSPIAMYVDESIRVSVPYKLCRPMISTGLKCCVDRRARCTERMRPGAQSASIPQIPASPPPMLHHRRTGNFHDYSVRAAAGMPLIEDTLGVRAAVMYENRDGWVTASCRV